jgi:hypothetical protein
MRKLVMSFAIAGASITPFMFTTPAHAKPPAHCGGNGEKKCPPPAPPCELGLIVNSQGICVIP